MSSITDLDTGPLTWVKGEIDLALGRATDAIKAAQEGKDRTNNLQFAQTHLHQVRGALSIVGLDGLTTFADSLDRLLSELARGEREYRPELADLCCRALAAAGNYLDELSHGVPDQALRLLPLLGELAAAREVPPPGPEDMFFPDLGQRPVRKAKPVPPKAEEILKARIRPLRAKFQGGLLSWIRTPDDAAGPLAMAAVCAELETLHSSPTTRSFWWAANAFFDTLANGGLTGNPAAKHVCSRIDLQLKRMVAGQGAPSERVHRELLYVIASAPRLSPAAQEVRDAYALERLLPPPGSALCDQPIGPLMTTLRGLFAEARDTWDHFAGGAAAALPQFDDDLKAAIAASAPLGRPAFRHLLDTLAQVVAWLRKDPLRINESVALEVASAVMLAETALETGRVPDASFTAQVARSESRLAAIMAGEDVNAAQRDSADLPDAAREAQERMALGQLAREMQVNLAQIEQTLDDYFRHPDRKAGLPGLNAPLRQIEGVLVVLGEDRAREVLKDCEQRIKALAESEGPPPDGEFEHLAHHLSAFGFFVQDLQRGNADLDRLLRGMEDETAAFEAPPPDEVAAISPPELDQLAVADEPLAEAEAESPPALEELAGEVADVNRAPAAAPPTAAPVPPPPAPELLQSSDAEVDSELLEIFIEEGHEVVATIGESLAGSRANPHDVELVTTIRRGFHTLKGSGRMVGLSELGEAAWEMEQTLNRWLQLEWEPTPALHDLIDEAQAQFGGWVEQLESGGSLSRDASAMIAEAQRLRASDQPIADSQLASEEIEATPVAAPDQELAELSAMVPELPLESDLELGQAEAPLVADEGLAEIAELAEQGESLPDAAPASQALEAEEASAMPAPSSDEEAEEALRETALELGDLEAEGLDEVLPIGTLTPPYSGIETSLDAFEQSEQQEAASATETAGEGEVSLDDLDFGDLDAAEEITLSEGVADLPADGFDLEVREDQALPGEQAAAETPAPEEGDRDTIADQLEADIGDESSLAESVQAAAQEERAEAPVESIDEELAEAPIESTDEDLAELDFDEAPEAPAEALVAAAVLRIDEAAEDPDVVRLGDQTISRPLFDLYMAEARQHLATLKREFGHLKFNPTLLPATPSIRAAHTLAGISGTAHVESVQLLAKSLEHAQGRFRDAERAPASEQSELLLRCTETLEAMLVEVARETLPLAVPELIEQLDGMLRTDAAARPAAEAPVAPEQPAAEAPAPALHDEFDEQLLPIFLEEGADLLQQLQSGLRAWREAPADAEPVTLIARLLHTLKGSARMAGAMGLGEQVHELETRLQEEDHSSGKLIDELQTGLDAVSQALDEIAAGPAPAPAPVPERPQVERRAATRGEQPLAEVESPSAAASLRVRADLVDKFVNEAGEIGIARTRIDGELRTLRRSLLDLTENVIRLRNQLREIEIQAETQLQSRIALSSGAEGEFDPLELDRFTRLQELTRMMAESVNDVTTVQHNLLRNLDGAESALSSQARLNRDLQQALMRVRMVPFESIADRLHRVVRQGAKDMGKRVTLDIQGGMTEIDRSVLERMTAPLEHLLRNSIAHGIESAEQRRAAGKAEIGQITLRIAQEGNEVAIGLSDDGAGLDFAGIRQRALDNRLIEASEVADEKRLTNLIFMPGFSTATSLSAVSGRGVGMDVVKSETAAVGGRIDISSQSGAGTTFRIYLPVNLAVTQALLVRAGARTYAIPSTMVAQVREIKVDALEELRRERQLTWQDEVYTYRYLPRLVGDAETQPEAQRFNWILLLRAGAQTLALHVDGLRGNQEIVVKNAGPHIARIVGISGATVMGDGEIVLIINPVALATRADVIPEDSGGERREAQPIAHVPTVMVVDDSLTVRKIAGRLLERAGYRVVTAKDGVDALERLIETVPDVVLSDIEMPRMDGFDLARNIRADQRLKTLPIIMITSRLAEKHKEYAREIGVNHYLGKPYDEDELLTLIARYAPLHAAA